MIDEEPITPFIWEPVNYLPFRRLCYVSLKNRQSNELIIEKGKIFLGQSNPCACLLKQIYSQVGDRIVALTSEIKHNVVFLGLGWKSQWMGTVIFPKGEYNTFLFRIIEL